ncbi:MAG: YsnF/AvaK domain-containing protein [Chloroflexaceae bacterium]
MKELHSTPVVGKAGLCGTLESVGPTAEQTTDQAHIRLADGQSIIVPLDALVVQEDGSYYLPLSQSDIEQYRTTAETGANQVLVVPVIAEELEVEKRTVQSGRVRLTKTVHEREEVIDEPLLQEEVAVERVAINRVVDTPGEVRYEGDTMIIPLLEEVLVVEKRLLLKEEIRVTRQRTETHKPQRVTLRSEEVNIERQEP